MNKLQLFYVSLFLCLTFTSQSFAQIPEPEDGKGLVVFYRPKKFSGGAITFNIQDQDKNYGPLKNGNVIYVQANPGQHTYFSQVISADAITLTIEPGQVYYVKAIVRVGYVAGRPKFEQVDEKKALKELN